MGIFEAVLILLAGCGVFIAGMNMLSGGLEKRAGGGMKKLFGKISGNRFAGVGVGAAATAIIQSSSATSVMVIGFVNAGVMTLAQATSIIMGANIGTTVTGILVSLKSLNISLYASLLAFIGVMMSFMKKDNIKQLGGILCGLGLIFVGLDVMGGAFDGTGLSAFFQEKVFSNISFPLLLILCGVAFTALIQSSSAATGLFITMVGAGALQLDQALFLVLGSNIGTCVTAVLASIGATVSAKRTAFIHLTFNLIGTILFTAVIWIFKDKAVWLLQAVFPNNTQVQLAWFHVAFNVSTTLVLLPFVSQLVKLATFVVREKPITESEEGQLKYVDERLLKTPHVALMQVKKEVEYMAAMARENLDRAFAAMRGNSEEYGAEVTKVERAINFTNNAVTKYLIMLSPLVDAKSENTVGSYFHVLNDLERIGDHAENFYEIASEMQNEGLTFSDSAMEELAQMQNKVLRMFEIAANAFDSSNTNELRELTQLENEVDDLKRELTASHYKRLAEGNCKVTLSPYFSSTVAGLERVADHLINVGYSILDPTGSQSRSKKLLEANE